MKLFKMTAASESITLLSYINDRTIIIQSLSLKLEDNCAVLCTAYQKIFYPQAQQDGAVLF